MTTFFYSIQYNCYGYFLPEPYKIHGHVYINFEVYDLIHALFGTNQLTVLRVINSWSFSNVL